MRSCSPDGVLSAARRTQARASLAACLVCTLALPFFSSAQSPDSAAADRSETHRRFEEARALQEKGLYREARKAYESLLPQLRAQKNEPDLATALNKLSLIASEQGDYGLAIAWARESADLFHKMSDRNGEARAINNLGVGELNRGDYCSAKLHFKQALGLYQKINDREGEIEQFNNIGNACYFKGRYLDALEAYEAAMTRVERAAGEPWSARRRQLTAVNLATLFQRLGREERALHFYQQAQQGPQALQPNEEAQLYSNLGVMYRRLGDPVKALEIYRQAHEIFARRGHKGGQGGVLINIGIALALDLGDLTGALESFTDALTLAEQTLNRRRAMQARLYRGESLLRLNQVDAARKEFEAAMVAAKELGTAEEEWKAVYGLGRIAELVGDNEKAAAYFRQAIARIESIRSRLQLSPLKAEFLGDKRDVYDSLINLLLNNPDAAELFNLMEKSRARTFQDRLQQPEGGSSTSAQKSMLDQVRNRLDDATLLLEFWVGPRGAAVVWVTREAFGIARHSLSPADVDEVSAFLQDLPTGSGKVWRKQSERLGKLLLSGIEPLARPGLQHLLVVPDGVLSAVPFEVLRAGRGDSSLLIEQFDITYLPSSSILLRAAPDRGRVRHFPWHRELLALGDPIPSNRADPTLSDVLPGDELRERLPTSAAEVQAIARLSSGRSEIHLGADDLKKYLLEGKASGVPLLHLSSHATADTDNPERSRILFSSEDKDSRPDYLFLREVYELDLRGVELAILSACDTERGKMIPGEGVQGFSRALLSAGSSATVTTLWRVADQPTSEFMKQFYYALGQGKTKAEALRWAKLKFFRSGATLEHPRYWAAFVLNGDGFRPITRAFSWSVLLGPLAAALVLVSVVAHRRVKAPRPSEAPKPSVFVR